MTWDAAKGRSVAEAAPSSGRLYYNAIYPQGAMFERAIQAPRGYYQALDKADIAGWASFWLAIENLIAAWFVYRKPPAVVTIAGLLPNGPLLACLAFAFIGFALTLGVWRRRPAWAAIAILVWVVLQAFHRVTFPLYGVWFPFWVSFGLFCFSIEGVRGALGLRDYRRPAWASPPEA
jgi:hypothetical protein